MRYQLAFKKPMESNGEESALDPTRELDLELPDGIVAEKSFVERLESDAEHGEDALDEDDAFLGAVSTEVWEYEVVDSRKDEFEDAMRNSRVVFEFNVIDESEIADPAVSDDVLEDRETSRSENEIEGLPVGKAQPPQLGLTDPSDPESDWAANTGPARNATDEVGTRYISDKGSTLGTRKSGR
jgi:hypothetical protein